MNVEKREVVSIRDAMKLVMENKNEGYVVEMGEFNPNIISHQETPITDGNRFKEGVRLPPREEHPFVIKRVASKEETSEKIKYWIVQLEQSNPIDLPEYITVLNSSSIKNPSVPTIEVDKDIERGDRIRLEILSNWQAKWTKRKSLKDIKEELSSAKFRDRTKEPYKKREENEESEKSDGEHE